MTKKKAMLEALEETGGRVASAIVKCTATLDDHKEWLKSDPKYKARVEFLAELEKDKVEEHMMKMIAKGNAQVIIHVLKTKLADREYTTEQSIGYIGDEIEIGWDDEA